MVLGPTPHLLEAVGHSKRGGVAVDLLNPTSQLFVFVKHHCDGELIL